MIGLLRACTYNVHLWADAQGRSNVDRVIALLRSLDCDVVALQEVLRDGDQLDRVASSLGMHRAFGAESWLGNALLARHPLDAVATTAITTSNEEGRCVLAATVLDPAGRFDVCVTHLDPAYEVTRLRQVEKLIGSARLRASDLLLMGDLNALRLADYPPSALAAVRSARSRHGREEPRGDVIARLDVEGYVDTLRLSLASGLPDYHRSLATALPDHARVTCWAGTRIDYVLASTPFLARYALESARHVDDDASDHAAVVVDFVRSDASM